MKLKIKLADQIVGLFVLIAIAAICVIFILLGANQRWFAEDFYFTSEFTSGQGLKEGMAIKMKGFQIGSVDEIILQEDNNVGIRFHIYDTYYEKITVNSVLELSVSPIGLGGGLFFYPGIPTGELIPAGEKIPSLDFAEGKKLIKLKLTEKPEGGDAITGILNSIGPLLDNVNSLSITLSDTLGNVNQGLGGDEETPVGEILTQVALLTESVNTLLNDITGSISSTLANVDDITGKAYNITDNLDIMTGDPTGLVMDLLDPQGSVATILNDDDQLFNQINGILAEINSTIAQLQQFTVYLNDTQPQITGILDQGKDALEKGKEVLEGVSNNPLLRGGITDQEEQGSTFQGYRDEDF
ncbi:MAG: MCE family protein [Spirochaetales bacterium]|nr:MCE family protein [Spirochaetales bacterium]